MPYYISYKGKKLGAPMSKVEAEEKLMVLSRCFKQLEIVKESARPPAMPIMNRKLVETN